MASWSMSWHPTKGGELVEDNSFDKYLQSTTMDNDKELSTLDNLIADMSSGSVFCTLESVESSVRYLNNVLPSFGVNTTLEFKAPTEDDTVAINVIYALLQQRQKDAKFREEIDDKLRRLKQDRDQAATSQKRAEDKLLLVERELVATHSKERSKEETQRKLKEKWDNEKDDLTRQLVQLQHRDVQYQHEVRKKEREYTKLQDRLRDLLMERNKEAKAGMDVLQTLQKEGRKRGGWKTGPAKGKTDEDMYQMIITTYEAKQKEITAENNDLRESLKDLQTELQMLLNTKQSQPGKRLAAEEFEVHKVQTENGLGISSGHFDMPFSMSRAHIEDNMRSQMKEYREKMDKSAVEAHAADMESLRSQLAQCRRIIDEQERLIQLSSQSDTTNPSEADDPNQSRIELSKRFLEEEMRLFDDKKQHFEEERKKCTEASIKLAQERKEIQALKAQLERAARAYEVSSQPFIGDDEAAENEELFGNPIGLNMSFGLSDPKRDLEHIGLSPIKRRDEM